MNVQAVATAMVDQAQETRRNITLNDALGDEWFWQRQPMVAPLKNGLLCVVVNDDRVDDLDRDAAIAAVIEKLNSVRFMGSPKARARLDARLVEKGWQA